MHPILSSLPAPASPENSISRDDDAQVVVLAKRDPHAFALLCARCFDPVYRYCYRRIGRPEAADAAARRRRKGGSDERRAHDRRPPR